MLMESLYNIGILFYGIAIRQYARYNTKAAQWIDGRKDWERKLKIAIHQLPQEQPRIWVHVASLGEFEQGRPIIEAIRQKHPDYLIILSFFSPSGYEIRKNYKETAYVCYLPLDTHENAFRFLHILNPAAAIFVKYEFWHNYLTGLEHWGIPVFLVAAKFRQNQIFFKPWGRFFRNMLHVFEHIMVQDNSSANLLRKAGINRVTITGDSRVDRVMEIASSPDSFPEVEKFKNGAPVIVFGSSWAADEEVFCKWINEKLTPGWKVILAPHEVKGDNINKLQKAIDLPSIRYSQLPTKTSSNVLIIDNVGMLAHLYQFGDIAYVGGGFGKSIHNILEPAAFGLPTIIGPNYQKFEEAIILKEKGAVFPIRNYPDFCRIMETLTELPIRKEIRHILADFFSAQRGATQKTLHLLGSYLD